jgi:urea transport system substrate-binding protein
VLIGEVQKDGTFKILENDGVIQPLAWSPLLEESRGYRCDWTADRPDAGKFRQ